MVRRIGLIIGGLGLAACVDPGMVPNTIAPAVAGTVTAQDTGTAGPNLSTLDKRQREALKRGCRDRYGDHTGKYEQCVEGDRHSEDALVQGCNETWGKDVRRLRACLGL